MVAQRIVGEFSPPRELVIVAAARVSGAGVLEVRDGGVAVEGRILGVTPPVPPWASLVVVLVGLAIWAVIPASAVVLTPATTLVVLGILWLRYRAEFGTVGTYFVPWGAVQHVVRLPASPDVVAIVFERPLAGRGTPEQVYFTATEGISALLSALRERAPERVTWDLDSAELPSPPGDDADGD